MRGGIVYSRPHGGYKYHLRRASGSAVVGVNHVEALALCGFKPLYWQRTDTKPPAYYPPRQQCAPCIAKATAEGLI